MVVVRRAVLKLGYLTVNRCKTSNTNHFRSPGVLVVNTSKVDSKRGACLGKGQRSIGAAACLTIREGGVQSAIWRIKALLFVSKTRCFGDPPLS